MPGSGATDPEDNLAKGRRELGLSRQLQVTRRDPPHPGIGGSTGYSEWYRVQQLQARQNGQPVSVSEQSLSRWRRKIHCQRQAGNSDRNQLVGVEMINLAVFIIAHPQSTVDEMAVHIYNKEGGLNSAAIVSKRLHELQVTKKMASTDAFQAQRPDVQEDEVCVGRNLGGSNGRRL